MDRITTKVVPMLVADNCIRKLEMPLTINKRMVAVMFNVWHLEYQKHSVNTGVHEFVPRGENENKFWNLMRNYIEKYSDVRIDIYVVLSAWLILVFEYNLVDATQCLIRENKELHFL